MLKQGQAIQKKKESGSMHGITDNLQKNALRLTKLPYFPAGINTAQAILLKHVARLAFIVAFPNIQLPKRNLPEYA